ncbi:MAG: hypothetical protein EPO68_08930 [Planctomycetota bacterium]|nr:MAG: hypothetical protein EPO68_08930 [Planctomycetota bacterium]
MSIPHPSFLSVRSVAAAIALALSIPAAAQWSSIPYDSSKSIAVGNWFVAHQTPAGHQAYSAIAQGWTNVAPSSATVKGYGDGHVIYEDGTGNYRGWSAFSNSSAAQSFAPGASIQNSVGAGTAYTTYYDLVPFTNGVLRAYSQYTNTWASVALTALPATSLKWAPNVAVQKDGLHYHAYSAYTGQWVTLDVGVEGGIPIVGPDYAAVDLRGTSGPFQYAAFSAPRGKWTLSPVYPTTGAGLIAQQGANALAIRSNDTGSTFRYAGYTPITGAWTTSSFVHATSSSQSGLAFKNTLRVLDTDTSVRFEIFGAGNGIWQGLAGTNLVEESLHDDFHVVKDSAGSSTTLHIASAMVGGGYLAHVVPSFFPSVGQGSHGCAISGSNDPSTNKVWAYSALAHAIAGPIAQPLSSGVSSANAGSVLGFNLQGSASFGATAWAHTSRYGQWVAGPALNPSESWTTLAPFGSGSLLAAIRNNFTSHDLHVFDEHRGTWVAPLNTTAGSFTIAQNAVFIPNPTTGVYQAYSAQRGTWSTQGGIGAITNPGGIASFAENLIWFTDSNAKLWAFSLCDRAQAWFQYPTAAQYHASGATSGGATPYLPVSVRGAPSTELALVYASLALGPAPLSLPGFGGTLDLSLGGAFQLANLGVFDADGVRDAKIPLANPIGAGTQGWMQAVIVDLTTLSASFAGRATGARFY